MNKRVVITGLGAVTALGEGARTLFDAALEGRSGIDSVSLNGSSESWTAVVAAIPGFQPEKFVTQRKALKVMARDIQLAVAGASLAMDDAGARNLAVDRERFGVIVGSGVLNHELDELAYSVQASLDEKGKLDLLKFGDQGMSSLFPLWLLKYLPNMPACHISIFFDLQGMNNTITTGASAGLQAVGEAFHIVQRGDADLMLAGGAESKVNPVGFSQYQMMGVLTGDTGDPKKRYRPFDADARGIVIGEGAGFLVLEEYEHAKSRGAKIYAEITGVGSAHFHGHTIAMKAALDEAGITASKVQYVQACGLGLPEEDRIEAAAIREVFGSSRPFVSASKPVTGFTGFSSGALDLVISTQALDRQEIPPVLNFSRSGDNFDLPLRSKTAGKPIEYAMTNAFGMNGPSISVVTRAMKDAK